MAMYNVLIVDDSADVRMVMTEMLYGDLFKCYEAADGQEALNLITERNDIDIVFTDIEMPRMNGLDLVASIRKMGFLKKRTPVVAVTAYYSQTLHDKFKSMGFTDILIKPHTEDDLKAVIQKYCR